MFASSSKIDLFKRMAQNLGPEETEGLRREMIGTGPNGPTPMAAPGEPATRPAGMFGNAAGLPKPDAALMPQPERQNPGRGGGWRDQLGTFGALLAASYGNPAGQLFMQMRQQREQEAGRSQRESVEEARQLAQFEWQRQRESRPELRTVNGQVVAVPWDGSSAGEPEVIHTAPEDFETYAETMGLEPGTEEYRSAMQDFVLRGQGPTAYGNRRELEGLRQGFRRSLLERREQLTRERPERPGRAGGPPRSEQALYTDLMSRHQRGERLNVEQREWIRAYEARQQARIRGRGRSGRPGAGRGTPGNSAVARGPDGRRYVPRGNQWVPID